MNRSSLQVVAEIHQAAWQTAVFGDTDHDGKNEVILCWPDSGGVSRYWILEEQEDNEYSIELVGGRLIPFAAGDLDRDGKSELIGQVGSQICVYEALDPASYPTELVWTSPAISNIIASATVGDTDRDGHMEIIWSQNFDVQDGNLLFFENTGDNSFELVGSVRTVGSENTAEQVVGDFDGDGLIEIATSGDGYLNIFEAVADNSWLHTWSYHTGMINNYALEGGIDTDGNGKPELFLMGNCCFPREEYRWTTMVFEAVADNEFALVGEFRFGSGIGYPYNALGDLDGDGESEYLMEADCVLLTYRATGIGSWGLSESQTDPGCYRDGLFVFDVNGNGRSEVFWLSNRFPLPMTVVLEAPRTPVEVFDLAVWQEGTDVMLRWLTSAESDVRAFRVFRARDAGAFQPLKPDIQPNSSHVYSFRDPGVLPAAYAYRIGEVSRSGEVTLHSLVEIRIVPAGPPWSYLSVPVPNPCNPSTTLEFGLASEGPSSLRIYDVRGHLVRTLMHRGRAAAGHEQMIWNGLDDDGQAVGSGVYHIVLHATDGVRTRRVTLLR